MGIERVTPAREAIRAIGGLVHSCAGWAAAAGGLTGENRGTGEAAGGLRASAMYWSGSLQIWPPRGFSLCSKIKHSSAGATMWPACAGARVAAAKKPESPLTPPAACRWGSV